MVTSTVMFGVATVCFKGRRLGFVEFLLRLKVIDWLSSAALSLSLARAWSLTGALTLTWPHLPAPRPTRSEE